MSSNEQAPLKGGDEKEPPRQSKPRKTVQENSPDDQKMSPNKKPKGLGKKPSSKKTPSSPKAKSSAKKKIAKKIEKKSAPDAKSNGKKKRGGRKPASTVVNPRGAKGDTGTGAGSKKHPPEAHGNGAAGSKKSPPEALAANNGSEEVDAKPSASNSSSAAAAVQVAQAANHVPPQAATGSHSLSTEAALRAYLSQLQAPAPSSVGDVLLNHRISASIPPRAASFLPPVLHQPSLPHHSPPQPSLLEQLQTAQVNQALAALPQAHLPPLHQAFNRQQQLQAAAAQNLLGLQLTARAPGSGATLPLAAAVAAQVNLNSTPQIPAYSLLHQLTATSTLSHTFPLMNASNGNGQALQAHGQSNHINDQLMRLLLLNQQSRNAPGMSGSTANEIELMQALAANYHVPTRPIAQSNTQDHRLLQSLENAFNAPIAAAVLPIQQVGHHVSNGRQQHQLLRSTLATNEPGSSAAPSVAPAVAVAAAAAAAAPSAAPHASAPASGDTTSPASGKTKPSKKKKINHRANRWQERFSQLKEFKQDHGHCRVPHGHPPNKKLAWWVMNIRAQYQKMIAGEKSWLTAERVQALDEIGFEWCPIVKSSPKKKKG